MVRCLHMPTAQRRVHLGRARVELFTPGVPLIAAMPVGQNHSAGPKFSPTSMTTSGCYQRRAADTCSERCVSSVIRVRRTSEHSEKPEEVYQIIERKYPQFNKAPLLELFQRRPRKGWRGWGNEVRDDTYAQVDWRRFCSLWPPAASPPNVPAYKPLKRCAYDLSLWPTSFNSAASRRNEQCTSM